MLSELHDIMDKKVDVKAQNDLFLSLLKTYNDTGNEAALEKMWTIAYQCCCNILKKRFGSFMTWQGIYDKAVDMLCILFKRIKSRKYEIVNLPKCCEYIVMTVFYGSKARNEENMFAVSLDEMIENGLPFQGPLFEMPSLLG